MILIGRANGIGGAGKEHGSLVLSPSGAVIPDLEEKMDEFAH